jgi:hypothetical protein
MPGSHNPERPSYRDSNENEYRALFRRVQKAFLPEDMTKEKLAEWFNNETLADNFAFTKIISDLIERATTVVELKNIIPDAESLDVHSNTLLKRIEAKIEQIEIQNKEELIAESITQFREIAESKGIVLTENIIGRQEKWGERQVISIRDNKGRFVSWKRI